MLSGDQKRTRLDISRYLLSRYEDDPGRFIEWVETQEEAWVHHFDQNQEAEQTWKHPGSPLLRNLGEFIQQGR